MNATSNGFTLLELFVIGGPVMWPLLVFSIAVFGITVERIVYLIYHNLKLDDLKEKVESAIESGNTDEARVFLEGLTKKRMGARILLPLVKSKGLSERRLEKAVEIEAAACINSLENGFNFLMALGSIAPLTGFLGTVTGMIGAFKSIAEAADVNAQIVAAGIYEALITTVFGLCIAIVAMFAHSIFSNIVDRFISETEGVCSELIVSITEKNEAMTASAQGKIES